MFLRTVAPGIELRLFEYGHAETIFATVERHRDYLREWLPWVDFTRSPEDVRQFIARVRAQYESNQGPQMGIWIDGALSGSFGVHPIDWANRSAAVGYWIEPGHQGRGVITRCCRSMLDYLFGELGLHRVEIRCGTGNTKSCAVPARLGFAREGVLQGAEWVSGRWVDLVVWGLLDHQWRASGSAVL